MYYECIICSFLKLILAPCFPSITSNCRFGLELLPWTGLLVPMMPTEPKENKSQQYIAHRESRESQAKYNLNGSEWFECTKDPQQTIGSQAKWSLQHDAIEDRTLGELQSLRCLRQCQVADKSPHLKQQEEWTSRAGTHSGLMNCPENRRTGSDFRHFLLFGCACFCWHPGCAFACACRGVCSFASFSVLSWNHLVDVETIPVKAGRLLCLSSHTGTMDNALKIKGQVGADALKFDDSAWFSRCDLDFPWPTLSPWSSFSWTVPTFPANGDTGTLEMLQ